MKGVADFSGVWLFHCHIEWHVASGLIATFVEAPLELQQTLTLPQNHLDACRAGNVPSAGNAAGNNKDLLDLTGENVPPPRLPDGYVTIVSASLTRLTPTRFTLKGIIAFAFSTLMGIIGVYAVASYGMKTGSKKKRTAEREPLLASGEAGAEPEPTGRSVNGENLVRR